MIMTHESQSQMFCESARVLHFFVVLVVLRWYNFCCAEHDRDVSLAKNILEGGLRLIVRA